MSEPSDLPATEPEDSVWPPAPTPQERESIPAPPSTSREAPNWAALVPGIVVIVFLLICFLITLWFLGKLEHL